MAGADTRGEELIGRTVGGYHVEYRLGAGATGVVFRVKKGDGPPLALKVLHENLGSISSLKRRFTREARVLAKLEHPNVVHISDFGLEDGHTYIAMELLEGVTLEEMLESTPVEPSRGIEILCEVLKGLAFAHERQVVHRDLKPANVFLCRGANGEETSVKLLDFGLAKMLSDDDVAEDGTLTRRGRIVGTPAYMAPEQITGVSLDVRADVYAAGILLFELLADRRPFLSDRRSELLRAHLLEPVPPLAVAREGLVVHPELEGLVHKALEKDPSRRFANAGAMLEALEALPKNAARLETKEASPLRSRSGATSEVISSSERRAVSESVSTDPHTNPKARPLGAAMAPAAGAVVEAPPAKRSGGRGEGAAPVATTEPSAPATRPPTVSTTMLYMLGGSLFVIAALLWWALHPA